MIKVLHWNNSNSNSNSSNSTTEDDTGHDLVVPPFESLSYYYENTTGMQKHYGARPVSSSSYYAVVHEETNTKNRTEASSSSGCPELARWLRHEFRNPGCKQQHKALVCIFPTVILKLFHDPERYQTELAMFQLLRDPQYFPKLLYHTPPLPLPPPTLTNSTSTTTNTTTHGKTPDETQTTATTTTTTTNNETCCRLMVIENVFPLQTYPPEFKISNTFRYDAEAYEFYQQYYTTLFATYFTPNHIYPKDLNACCNSIIRDEYIRIIDFDMYQFVYDNDDDQKKNATSTLASLNQQLLDEILWDHPNRSVQVYINKTRAKHRQEESTRQTDKFVYNINELILFDASNSSNPDHRSMSKVGPMHGTPDTNLVYEWDFGKNGMTSSKPIQKVRYTSPGKYHVRLTVTDALGFFNTTSMDIMVGAPRN